MKRMGLWWIGMLFVAASPTTAQRGSHVVRGVVYDSVAHAPLAGAVVQITSRDSPGRPFSATTDATGHFRFGAVPSGRFFIGFYHEALRALGLDSPVRALQLAADPNVTVDLAIPSGGVVRALRCGGDAAVDRDGLLAGFVRDAVHKDAVVGARLVAEWTVVVLDPGNFHTAAQSAEALIGGDGRYAVCGLPVDAPLTVRVSAPGHRTIVADQVVPRGGAARQDFRLVDSTAVDRPVTPTGRAVYDNGGRPRR